MNYIFVFACAVLFIVPLYFVMHSVYDDGLIGRVGLLGISFSAATFLLEFADGQEYDMLPQTVFMAVMFAWFLCWHLFRFERRVLVRKAKGENQESTWISSR